MITPHGVAVGIAEIRAEYREACELLRLPVPNADPDITTLKSLPPGDTNAV